jgi:hypothetical protein
MDQKALMSNKVGQQENKTTLTQTIDMDWQAKEVGADGVATLAVTFRRIKSKIESALGSFDYDTKDPKAAGAAAASPVGTLVQALINAPFTCKMNPQGEISDVQVPESMVKAFRGAGPAAGMFSEDGLKQMILQLGLKVPKDTVAPGDTWSQRSDVPMQAIGTQRIDRTFRYQGPDPKAGKNLERIDLTTQVELRPDPKLEGIKNVRTTAQEGKGTYLFDNSAGRVADSSVTEKLVMVGTVSAGGINIDVTNGNETTTTMKLVPAADAGASK